MSDPGCLPCTLPHTHGSQYVHAFQESAMIYTFHKVTDPNRITQQVDKEAFSINISVSEFYSFCEAVFFLH